MPRGRASAAASSGRKSEPARSAIHSRGARRRGSSRGKRDAAFPPENRCPEAERRLQHQVEGRVNPREARFTRVERGEGGPQGGNATQRFPLKIDAQRPSVGCSIKWKEE